MTNIAETCRILADLIAFRTVSAESNLDLVAYASDLLSSLGASISLSLDESGSKANLFATIGQEGNDGIVLSGHTDVVPVVEEEWSSDPFELVERDGRLYGRGACDMKGFIAACLAMAPRFAETELKRPLHLAFTYDEEVGCFGARALVRELAAAEFRPSLAIIGEPTTMRVIEGHKGCYEYTTEFTGLEGHASRPDLGVNAVEFAGRYIARLLELADEIKGFAPADSPFKPPWTTLQVGRVQGGIARNVVAGHCDVEWEMRTVQTSDADFVKERIEQCVEEVLKPAMKRVSADADIVTRVIGEVEGLQIVSRSEARDIVLELTGNKEAEVVAFGTEAGLYQSLGISTAICGPGSILQAHKPDEYVEVTQLEACLDMLEGLRKKMAR